MGLWEQVLAVRAYVFENPLNVVLLVALVYLAYNTLRTPLSEEVTPAVAAARQGLDASSAYSSLPLEHPASIEFLTYTPRTLALQDGTNTADAAESSKILLAINGNVFDVTSGRNFYGPGGPYGNFAGRDASRGMAKQSFDTDTLTPLDQPLDTLADLTDAERKNMAEWESHFAGKYGIVGRLVNEGEQATAPLP